MIKSQQQVMEGLVRLPCFDSGPGERGLQGTEPDMVESVGRSSSDECGVVHVDFQGDVQVVQVFHFG
jgi:hypothetical protein